MLWILLSLVVALLKSWWEIAGKYFLQEKKEKQNTSDEYSLALWIRSILIFPLFIFLLFFQGSFALGLYDIMLIIFAAIWNAITTVTALKAVKHSDVSIVGPLWSLTIPFLLISGFYIAWELPNIYWVIGSILICIGTYFLWIKKWIVHILTPFKNLYYDIWARYMLITTFIWSITAPIDKLWIESLWVMYWLFLLNFSVSIFLFLYMRGTKKTISLSQMYSQKHLKKVSILALLMGWASLIQLFAIKYTLVVYVIAIKRASWIFSVIFWALFFHEKNIAQKLVATAIMVLWVCIISIWGNI